MFYIPYITFVKLACSCFSTEKILHTINNICHKSIKNKVALLHYPIRRKQKCFKIQYLLKKSSNIVEKTKKTVISVKAFRNGGFYFLLNLIL
jgi:hypothetical protein